MSVLWRGKLLKHSLNKVHNPHLWSHSRHPWRFSLSLMACCCSDPTGPAVPLDHLLEMYIAAADGFGQATADSVMKAADMDVRAASGDGNGAGAGAGAVGLYDDSDLSEGRLHTGEVVAPALCERGGGGGGT